MRRPSYRGDLNDASVLTMVEAAPGRSVVDPHGRVWGTRGIYVADGSILNLHDKELLDARTKHSRAPGHLTPPI